MKDLESYIRNNREKFEEDLPENHLRHFEKKMRKNNNFVIKYKNVFAMAATIIILIAAGSFFYFSNPAEFKAFLANPIQKSPLPQEIKVAMDYYNTMSTNHVKQINTLDLPQNELNRIESFAGQELQQYDNTARELKRQLRRHPENEMIKRALIMNQIKKNEFIKRVINQVRQTNTKEL